MATRLQRIPASKATVFSTGGAPHLLAAEGDATGKARRFAMEIYTGGLLSSWRWGNVVLDISGFMPHREDLAALRNHDRDQVAGATDKWTADQAKGTIACEGVLLPGTDIQEPTARMIERRLAASFPYQSSGRWQPLKTEEVQAGATAVANGKTITGPATIFRQFTCMEASFTEMGMDPMTSCVSAAKSADAEMEVQVEGSETQQPERPINMKLLPILASIFGADKAIVLAGAKPDATSLDVFAADIGPAVDALRASNSDLQAKLTEKTTAVATLEAKLEAARKNPAVLTLQADGSNPPTPPATPPAAGTEAALKAEYAASKDLQAEFPTEAHYVMFKQKSAPR